MNKWLLVIAVAVLALSLTQAGGHGSNGPREVLVVDLQYVMDSSQEHLDIVEKWQGDADKLQKEYQPQVADLQLRQKKLLGTPITDRDEKWYDDMMDAMKKEGELKAIEAAKKVEFQTRIAKASEKLHIAAMEQARAIMKARGADLVIASKLGPVVFKTEADMRAELLHRRIVAIEEKADVDITKDVLKAMDASYAKKKAAAGK